MIAGAFGALHGPVKDIVGKPLYLDVSVEEGRSLELALEPSHTAFCYVFRGAATIGATTIASSHAALLSQGDSVRVECAAGGCRMILVSGAALKEPIAWYGPIVMNTESELETAFTEYQAGTFVKVGSARR